MSPNHVIEAEPPSKLSLWADVGGCFRLGWRCDTLRRSPHHERSAMEIAHRAGPIATATMFVAAFLILHLFIPAQTFYSQIVSLFDPDIFLRPALKFAGGGGYGYPGHGLLWAQIVCFSLLAIVAVVVLVIRTASDQSRRSSRIVFRFLACAAFLSPVCMLIRLFLRLIWYIYKMGFTPARAAGILADIAVFASVAAFLALACGFTNRAYFGLTTASSEPSSAGAPEVRSR